MDFFPEGFDYWSASLSLWNSCIEYVSWSITAISRFDIFFGRVANSVTAEL